MAVPLKITGAGNQDARYVFRVTISEDLMEGPNIEAWDNAGTFPARTDPGATVANEIFTGTTENGSIPMLYAIATTDETPGDDWKPTAATAGGATSNRLMGDTSYVTDPTVPDASEVIYFNLGVEVPYDATIPSAAGMAHIIQIRMKYSGSQPTATIAANEGTEASPTWTNITPGTNGIKYCNAGTDWTTGPYKLTLPELGTVDAPEAGITV